ncbi:hypothetical protein GMB86_05895 [Terrilactibacillus sp. BCM23-1]|uniref:SGNH/GDSL hydrolase family protein n=1 Tax=Terrilactibacillus tamarindi TaxID=2599694 RepID=A0A6N8CU28_9BACI|nr:SGNH/GDSL hydrolase family protein [Terrilactibacillus tamarindi]MTT31546.1 hypothetical protein [Terrilactibacillus tamarindi]
MKKVALVLVIFIFVLTIIGGNMFWNHKLSKTYADAKVANKTHQDKTAQQEAKRKLQEQSKIDQLTARLPEPLKNKIRDAASENKEVQIMMIVGSDGTGVAEQLQTQLNKSYGFDLFKVNEENVGQSSSLDFYNKQLDSLLSLKKNDQPDVVIYTPLIYNDDHKVSTEDTEAVMSLVNENFKEKYSQLIFLVQPPNYSAKFDYLNDRIDNVKTYAKDQGITYLDYLTEWPKKAKARSKLTTKDGHTPNDQGKKVWTTYLTNYFTSED